MFNEESKIIQKAYDEIEKGNFSKAIEYFNRILENGENTIILQDKGYCLNELGLYGEAIKCFDRVITLENDMYSENYINAWFNKGRSFIGLNKRKEALACFNAVLSFNPHHANAQFVIKLLNDDSSIVENHNSKNMKVAIIETDKGVIELELFPNEAPGTVANFEKLINEGFYDGLTFHRVIPNFVIQGGCPLGNGMGGPGYTIKCEIEGNPHKHGTGALSMAHAGKDTGGSQFFITHSPQPHLDGVHTVFGQVIKGQDVVNAIQQGDHMNKLYIEER